MLPIYNSRMLCNQTERAAADTLGVSLHTWQKWEAGLLKMPIPILRLYRHLVGIEQIPFRSLRSSSNDEFSGFDKTNRYENMLRAIHAGKGKSSIGKLSEKTQLTFKQTRLTIYKLAKTGLIKPVGLGAHRLYTLTRNGLEALPKA